MSNLNHTAAGLKIPIHDHLLHQVIMTSKVGQTGLAFRVQ